MQLVERYLHEAGNLENVRSPRRMFSGPLCAVIGGGSYEKGA